MVRRTGHQSWFYGTLNQTIAGKQKQEISKKTKSLKLFFSSFFFFVK